VPITFERTVQEGLHLAVDLFAQATELALGNSCHAHGLDQIIDGTRRDALNVGLLDHGSQRLLGHPPRFKETREVATFPQLRSAQLDRPSAGLPVPVTISVPLRQPRGILLAIASARGSADLQLHQALGSKANHKANHLAQQISVRGLLDELAQVHHVIGHRGNLRPRLVSATRH
jgi:hypothetical protein